MDKMVSRKSVTLPPHGSWLTGFLPSGNPPGDGKAVFRVTGPELPFQCRFLIGQVKRVKTHEHNKRIGQQNQGFKPNGFPEKDEKDSGVHGILNPSIHALGHELLAGQRGPAFLFPSMQSPQCTMLSPPHPKKSSANPSSECHRWRGEIHYQNRIPKGDAQGQRWLPGRDKHQGLQQHHVLPGGFCLRLREGYSRYLGAGSAPECHTRLLLEVG